MCEVPNSMCTVEDMPESAGENYNIFCENAGCEEIGRASCRERV